LKIAFTADLHLTTNEKNPERFRALKDIFRQCGEEQIQLLIIAGDLFDKAMANYADFEKLYRDSRPDGLKTIIIPGNHDQTLKSVSLVGDGLAVFSEPVLQSVNNSRKILFLPYQPDQTMGEAIAPFEKQLNGERWILIAHGDWTGSINSSDPYEKGSYMPLTRTDLSLYNPELVFLGHIHLPQDGEIVHYPGSPCPLNITETGPRRFLVFDTNRGEIKSMGVDPQLEYYDERFVMLPVENDMDILISDIQQRTQSWKISPSREDFIQVRVKITGTALSDRNQILSEVKKVFSPYNFYQDQEPNLSELSHNPDPDRAEISQLVKIWIDNVEWDELPEKPSKSQILEEALKIIYGGE